MQCLGRLSTQGKFPCSKANSLLNLPRELTAKQLKTLGNFPYRLTERWSCLDFPAEFPASGELVFVASDEGLRVPALQCRAGHRGRLGLMAVAIWLKSGFQQENRSLFAAI